MSNKVIIRNAKEKDLHTAGEPYGQGNELVIEFKDCLKRQT